MPVRLLQGLVPATLLEQYDFYQDLSDVDTIRGYPQTPPHHLEGDDAQVDDSERSRVAQEARQFRLSPRPPEFYAQRIEMKLMRPSEGHTVYSAYRGSKVFAQIRRLCAFAHERLAPRMSHLSRVPCGG